MQNSTPQPFASTASTFSQTKSFSTLNNLKTFGLLAAMTALFLGVGAACGRGGFYIALFFAGAMNGLGYWFSDKIALAMSGAKPVSPQDAPRLHAIVEALAARASLPKPRVYVIPQMAPNAFATGRDPRHAAVAVTQGLLSTLSEAELEGVLAHELAHVRHRDILIASVAAVLAGAMMHLAQMLLWFGGGGRDRNNPLGGIGALLMLILAPLAAALIQMAISRSREFEADRLGAQLCGNPLFLAGALKKLEAGAQVLPMHADAAMSHMYIVNPLRGADVSKLFRTHPPTAERIARLEAMARENAANPFG